MPSIATVARSQCNPSTFGGAVLAVGTRQRAPRSTVLLAAVAGAEGGNTALGGIHVLHTLGRRAVSLPLGVVSAPKYLYHSHIPSDGVLACLAFRTVDRSNQGPSDL